MQGQGPQLPGADAGRQAGQAVVAPATGAAPQPAATAVPQPAASAVPQAEVKVFRLPGAAHA